MAIDNAVTEEDEAARILATGPLCKRVFGAMLIAALLLAVFNSQGLVSWVLGLPSGPIEDEIVRLAKIWHSWMDALGVSDYIGLARDQVRSLKEARW